MAARLYRMISQHKTVQKELKRARSKKASSRSKLKASHNAHDVVPGSWSGTSDAARWYFARFWFEENGSYLHVLNAPSLRPPPVSLSAKLLRRRWANSPHWPISRPVKSHLFSICLKLIKIYSLIRSCKAARSLGESHGGHGCIKCAFTGRRLVCY